MTRPHFFFILIVLNFIYSCNYKRHPETERVVVQEVVIEDGEDRAGPPPPNLTSEFKTLHDWLFDICVNDKPGKSISTFNFGLYESAVDKVIFLVGMNISHKGNSSTSHIEFEPGHMYFKLPVEYNHLNHEQVWDTLNSQIADFTKTDKFKNSFLSKADSITTDAKGKIWPK